MSLSRVGSVVTARCGDAPPAPPWPKPKFPAAAPFAIFRQALTVSREKTCDSIGRMVVKHTQACQGGSFFKGKARMRASVKPIMAAITKIEPEGEPADDSSG